MVYAPIYKDTVYTYSGDTLFFRIESPSGNTLLRGEASVRPDGTPAQVYVNRLCEPFLNMELEPTVTGLTAQTPAAMDFYLVADDETGQTLETYRFLRMYSSDWSGGDKVLSDPIKPNISETMVMPFSIYKDNSGVTNDYASFHSAGLLVYNRYFYGTNVPYRGSFGPGPIPIKESVHIIEANYTGETCEILTPGQHCVRGAFHLGLEGSYFSKPNLFRERTRIVVDNSDGLMATNSYMVWTGINTGEPYGSIYFFPTQNLTNRKRRYRIYCYYMGDDQLAYNQLVGVFTIIQNGRTEN